jgi:hypothetical protein
MYVKEWTGPNAQNSTLLPNPKFVCVHVLRWYICSPCLGRVDWLVYMLSSKETQNARKNIQAVMLANLGPQVFSASELRRALCISSEVSVPLGFFWGLFLSFGHRLVLESVTHYQVFQRSELVSIQICCCFLFSSSVLQRHLCTPMDLCEFVIWTYIHVFEICIVCAILCCMWYYVCLIFHFCIFYFFSKRVKNVGTHVLKVKNMGTVELNGKPSQTHAGPISSTTTWLRRT